MSYLREQIDYKGMSIKIYYDENADSPREWDNLGTIYSNHRDYNLDNHKIDELLEEDGRLHTDELDKYFIWLPVYAYEHSGITVSTGHGYPYNDRWDSGLFGIIAVSKERVRKEYGWKNITKERRQQIEGHLRNEIKDLDTWFTGQVFGFVAEDENESHLDSCWGYYGNDGIKEAIEEAKAAIDCELDERAKAERKAFIAALASHVSKRKEQIKHHAPLYARTAFAY